MQRMHYRFDSEDDFGRGGRSEVQPDRDSWSLIACHLEILNHRFDSYISTFHRCSRRELYE